MRLIISMPPQLFSAAEGSAAHKRQGDIGLTHWTGQLSRWAQYLGESWPQPPCPLSESTGKALHHESDLGAANLQTKAFLKAIKDSK